jgi:hypothetical protein
MNANIAALLYLASGVLFILSLRGLSSPETSRAAFDQQIRYLYERVTGLPLGKGAPEVDEMMALWTEIYALEGSVEKSWATVLSVILRDPHILFY